MFFSAINVNSRLMVHDHPPIAWGLSGSALVVTPTGPGMRSRLRLHG